MKDNVIISKSILGYFFSIIRICSISNQETTKVFGLINIAIFVIIFGLGDVTMNLELWVKNKFNNKYYRETLNYRKEDIKLVY